MQARHGGQILVDQLATEGVERVFSVPGESFLAVLDGLHGSGIQNVVCRQEGGAAMMASAHGKLTGAPGVALVTRGPGATNASAGVHVAMQDAAPMVLLVGQIARGHRDRGAFQEVDYRRFFAPLAKWVAEIDDPHRIPEYVGRAFHLAVSGRPGPVVLALPEDMLSAEAVVGNLARATRPDQAVAPAHAARIAGALARAERPLVIAGGPAWSGAAAADLERFAAAWDLPVAVAFRRQDYMDNDHPCYAGDLGVGMNPRLALRLREADCLLVLGAGLGDIETGGYAHVDPAEPGKSILHVHPDPDTPGSVYRPDIALAAPAPALVAELAGNSAPAAPAWVNWRHAAREDYLHWQTPVDLPGAVRMADAVCHLREVLPREAILTNGAGNYAAFVHRYHRFREHGTQLAPSSGSMGYGLPAAVAAKLAHPDRPVICFAGDGCFQMTGQEFSTAMQYRANIVVIVANNGIYGTIRMHQERAYPGRVSGTTLANPDFAALARAHGGHGETVETQAAFAPALDRALAAGVPAIIELKLDPEALSTAQTLSEVRARG